MSARRCVHYPPSPGQSLCQCRHLQIEAQYALAIVERSGAERLSRLRCALRFIVLCGTVAGAWAAIGFFVTVAVRS